MRTIRRHDRTGFRAETMRMRRLVPALAALALAGCGSSSHGPTTCGTIHYPFFGKQRTNTVYALTPGIGCQRVRTVLTGILGSTSPVTGWVCRYNQHAGQVTCVNGAIKVRAVYPGGHV